MRKLLSTFALAAFAASPLAAQAMPWTNEIGLTLNYSVTTVADDDITTIGFPAGNGYLGIGGVAGLYGVIPVNDRFAIEPSIGVNDIGFVGTPITTANFGARVLYSVAGGFYVGAGPSLSLLKLGDDQYSTWGVNAGVGYRRHLTGSLTGRAEVYYESMGESAIAGDETSSSIGLKLGLGLTPQSAASGRRMRSDAMWPLAIGFQGGYARTSADGFEMNGFSLPGSQNSVALGSFPLPGLAPLFVQIPVGERIAIEPSVSFSSFEVEGSPAISTHALGVRGNYAFNRTLYGAVSFDYLGYGSEFDIDASTGFGVAGGLRFPLMSGLTGRLEGSWRKFSGDEDFLGDFTVTGLSFAVSAPLK